MAKKEKKVRKKSTFFADFKKFITRGNVVDMAVAVVVGGAFSKIVTGLVNFIINPAVGKLLPAGSLDNIKTVLTQAVYADDGITVVTPEVAILWGKELQTIIDFLIIAFCIFVALRIITGIQNKLNDKKRLEEEKAEAEADAKAAEAAAVAAEAAAKAAAEEQAYKNAMLEQGETLKAILAEMKKK